MVSSNKHFLMLPCARDFVLAIYRTKKDTYLHLLSKKCNATYSYLGGLKIILIRENILEEKEKGRIKIINLTPKGFNLAKQLDIIDHNIRGVY